MPKFTQRPDGDQYRGTGIPEDDPQYYDHWAGIRSEDYLEDRLTKAAQAQARAEEGPRSVQELERQLDGTKASIAIAKEAAAVAHRELEQLPKDFDQQEVAARHAVRLRWCSATRDLEALTVHAHDIAKNQIPEAKKVAERLKAEADRLLADPNVKEHMNLLSLYR